MPSCAAAPLRLLADEVGVVPGEVCPVVGEKPFSGWSVYDGAFAVPCPASPCGVGSNLSQPKPWKYSSGHACASWVVTSHLPPYADDPAVKP